MSSRKIASAWFAGVAFLAGISFVDAQVVNPGIQQSGSVTAGHCMTWGPGVGQASDAGAGCATQSSSANPTATAGPAAIDGVATTFMRSDAAPAIQIGTNAVKGLVQGDGSSVSCNAGVCSAIAAPANPTALAGPVAINGAASTFMRSDGAPAVQQGSAAQKGIVQVDGTSVTASGGVISVPTGSAAQKGILQVDGTSIVATAGVISSASGTPANPTATAGPVAINGVASSYMRSDASPAIQLGTNAVKGLVQGDATTINCVAGICNQVNGASVQINTISRAVTSTSAVMGGFGGSCTITPIKTGRVNFFIQGIVQNSAGVNTNNTWALRYGTGTAPANGAAVTGTQIIAGNTFLTTPQQTSMYASGSVTGLSLGTSVWFDVSMLSGSGTFTLANANCTAIEF